MTYEELGKRIAAMSDEQRQQTAWVWNQDMDDLGKVDDLRSDKDFPDCGIFISFSKDGDEESEEE